MAIFESFMFKMYSNYVLKYGVSPKFPPEPQRMHKFELYSILYQFHAILCNVLLCNALKRVPILPSPILCISPLCVLMLLPFKRILHKNIDMDENTNRYTDQAK